MSLEMKQSLNNELGIKVWLNNWNLNAKTYRVNPLVMCLDEQTKSKSSIINQYTPFFISIWTSANYKTWKIEEEYYKKKRNIARSC